MSHTFADGQTLCPYNPSHVISRQRAIPHLAKCRLQHPDALDKVAICPFNQGHHIPVSDMATHLTTCPDHSAAKSVSSAVAASQTPHQPRPEEEKILSKGSKMVASSNPVGEDDINEWL